MITKRIIPCLDVKDGRVVKGVNFEGIQDVADPVELAKYYNETGADELKEIYNIMRETKGIYGGRFSGAGFKGCCMALIDPDYKESISRTVTDQYLKAFPGLAGKYSVHFCRSADGIIP